MPEPDPLSDFGGGSAPELNGRGGLRYHGMSPILSKLYHDGYMEATSVEQTRVFEAAVYFAKKETILPAPESAHAIRAAMDEALRCKETAALKNINIEINNGEFVVLCGKSGCGKSTLLRHFKTVLTPHGLKTGEILFQGKNLDDVDIRTQSSKIGFVLQNPDNQIVTDKVWHELAFGLESLGYDTPTIRLRVAEMASYFGIQAWFRRNVNELSGGQKQLLNLAAIMAMHPSLLILDEPTSQLDPIAASDFLETVKKINRDLGTTIIMTEHRLEDIFPRPFLTDCALFHFQK